MRGAEDFFRRRALKQPLQPSIATAAKNNEIDFPLSGKILDRCKYFSRQHRGHEMPGLQPMGQHEVLEPDFTLTEKLSLFLVCFRRVTERVREQVRNIGYVHFGLVSVG